MGSARGAGQKEEQAKLMMALLREGVPATLLGRGQTLFNTSPVRSQQKVQPLRWEAQPGLVLSPFVPKGHQQEMTSRSDSCRLARCGKHPLMEWGWGFGYGLSGKRMFV